MENFNEKVIKIVQDELDKLAKVGSFTDRKITDTPTDDLSVVSRKYVNMNASVASRPNSSVAQIGQQFYASDVNIPMFFDGINWRNGVGSIVALH